RSLIFVSFSTLFGAILPDQIGEFKKSAPKTIAIPDQALFAEYGFDATESADYGKFSVTAWRFHDSTRAMAMFEMRRPAVATLSNISKLAVNASDGVVFALGNYVFQITGAVPADLSPL